MSLRHWLKICGLLAGTVLLTPGCGDDDIVGGGGGVPAPTLENVWPNEDGRAWEYLLTSRIWADQLVDSTFIHTDPDSVPPAPPLSTVLEWLDDPFVPEPNTVSLNTYELRFDGMLTTASGAVGQNLVETIGDLPATGSFQSRFLRALALARPDLQPEIAQLGFFRGATDSFEAETFPPIFLHGGAWERTSDWIGNYGDLDTLLAWKYLEEDLQPGHSFVHQLVPVLAPDVYLSAQVVRRGPVATPVGTFDQALECIYLVDYGISTLTGVFQPDVLGYFRMLGVGKVIYAPTVGPVHLYERVLIPAGSLSGTGLGDVTVELTSIRAGNPSPAP